MDIFKNTFAKTAIQTARIEVSLSPLRVFSVCSKHRTDVFQRLFSANTRYFSLFVGPIVTRYFFLSGSEHNSFLVFDLFLYSLSL